MSYNFGRRECHDRERRHEGLSLSDGMVILSDLEIARSAPVS